MRNNCCSWRCSNVEAIDSVDIIVSASSTKFPLISALRADEIEVVDGGTELDGVEG